jgi:hypothetical protein
MPEPGPPIGPQPLFLAGLFLLAFLDHFFAGAFLTAFFVILLIAFLAPSSLLFSSPFELLPQPEFGS